MATRDLSIELVENEEFFLLWSRIDHEMEINEEIIVVWNGNEEYK